MTAIPYYNTHAPALAQQYEALSAASVHSWLGHSAHIQCLADSLPNHQVNQRPSYRLTY
jgi:hypothetical protein